MARRKRSEPPPQPLTLDPIGRELLGKLLVVARDATSFLPEGCQGFLYGRPRNLRYELVQALNVFEDHLDREGEAFR